MDKWLSYSSPISASQFAYPYGVPRWGRQLVEETAEPTENALGAVRSPLVTSGSHGRAGPPPSDRAAQGGW